jgi:hypothetical protein
MTASICIEVHRRENGKDALKMRRKKMADGGFSSHRKDARHLQKCRQKKLIAAAAGEEFTQL